MIVANAIFQKGGGNHFFSWQLGGANKKFDMWKGGAKKKIEVLHRRPPGLFQSFNATPLMAENKPIRFDTR